MVTFASEPHPMEDAIVLRFGNHSELTEIDFLLGTEDGEAIAVKARAWLYSWASLHDTETIPYQEFSVTKGAAEFELGVVGCDTILKIKINEMNDNLFNLVLAVTSKDGAVLKRSSYEVLV